MFAIEKELLKEQTNDLEIAAIEEDFINEIDDILEDGALGLEDDDEDFQNDFQESCLFSELEESLFI